MKTETLKFPVPLLNLQEVMYTLCVSLSDKIDVPELSISHYNTDIKQKV